MAMERPGLEIEAVRKNYSLLLTQLPGIEIAPELCSRQLISRANYEEMLLKQTHHESNIILLNSLQKSVVQSPKAFEQFLQVLMEHPNCSLIAEVLSETLGSSKKDSTALQSNVEEPSADDEHHYSSQSSSEITPVSSKLQIDHTTLPAHSRSNSSADSFHSVDDEVNVECF